MYDDDNEPVIPRYFIPGQRTQSPPASPPSVPRQPGPEDSPS